MAAETFLASRPNTDDTDPLLLKKIAASLHRATGNVPTRGIDSSNPIAAATCFGVEADSNGMTIATITAPDHSGQSLAGFTLAGGQTLDVYFTAMTVSAGRGVAFDAQ
jgi:hypothetical protein